MWCRTSGAAAAAAAAGAAAAAAHFANLHLNTSNDGGGSGIGIALLAASAESKNNQNDINIHRSSRLFSRDEVAQHNSEDDCWVVIGTDVFDLTQWLRIHPGRARPILAWQDPSPPPPFAQCVRNTI